MWRSAMAAARGSEERFAGAMESLVLLADSMQQAAALLVDAEDGDEASGQSASFLDVVALGSVVRCLVSPNFLAVLALVQLCLRRIHRTLYAQLGRRGLPSFLGVAISGCTVGLWKPGRERIGCGK